MDRAMPSIIKATVSKPIRNCFFYSCDVIILMAVMALQGTGLNIYIMNKFSESIFPKLLFIGDFACLAIALAGMRVTYLYLTQSNTEHVEDKTEFLYSPKKFIKKFPTSKLGMLPLSYLSWLVYVSFLLSKIVIIYVSGLTLDLKKMDFFGPSVLKMMIGLTSVIFMLFVESHNWSFVSEARRTYVTTMCVRTGFEIFDSVDMLSLITDQQWIQKTVFHDVTVPGEDLIFGLVALNFLLPILSLYKLSLADRNNESGFNLHLPIHILYHILHLFFVDLPFLSIRLYMWIVYETDISMFLMKNLLHIIINARNIYPEVQLLLQRKSSPPEKSAPEMEDIGLN